jgi:hypothetical protein
VGPQLTLATVRGVQRGLGCQERCNSGMYSCGLADWSWYIGRRKLCKLDVTTSCHTSSYNCKECRGAQWTMTQDSERSCNTTLQVPDDDRAITNIWCDHLKTKVTGLSAVRP